MKVAAAYTTWEIEVDKKVGDIKFWETEGGVEVPIDVGQEPKPTPVVDTKRPRLG